MSFWFDFNLIFNQIIFLSLDKSILQIRDWLALLESMIKKDRADMSDSGHIYHMLERQKVSKVYFYYIM